MGTEISGRCGGVAIVEGWPLWRSGCYWRGGRCGGLAVTGGMAVVEGCMAVSGGVADVEGWPLAEVRL